ncbi:MAG: heme exporter protein CcmB [Chloroflexi bacterium]|nr:heme exporter protein CcmB [Chloroflexota bacterium]MBF6606824.1 heme exporter protein CcmB [Chloroflexota bacterium]
MLADILALVAKDLRIELRTPASIAGALTLGLIGLVVTGLAAGPDTARLRTIAPGLAWLSIVYAAITVGERLDRIDRTDDAFSVLWLSVTDRRAIFAAKVVALTTVLWTITLTLLGAAVVLLNVELAPASVALVPLAGLACLALAGTVGLVTGVVGANSQRILLLPVTLLPLLAPTLLAAAQGTAAVLDGRLDAALPWSALLTAQAALFAGLGLLVYEAGAALE